MLQLGQRVQAVRRARMAGDEDQIASSGPVLLHLKKCAGWTGLPSS